MVVLLGIVHVALLGIWDLAAAPRLTVVLLIAGSALTAWAAWRLDSKVSAATVLAVALALRLLLLALPPTFSDDLLRYVWDGRVLSAGHDPYRHAPDDPILEPLRDARWDIMPHRHVPTVYPPLALGVFTLGGWLPLPLLGIKILLVSIDLGACWLLIRLARVRGRPPGRAIFYAWHPLVVLEGAGMGHIDVLLTAAIVATVLLLVEKRDLTAGFAAAAGVLAKLHPIVLMLGWARVARRRVRFLLGAGVLVAIGLLPVLLPGVPPGLVTYGVSWEFNGPLYEPLWRLFDHLDTDDWVKTEILDELKNRTEDHDRWNRVYPFVYPQLLAKLVLLGGFGLAWLIFSLFGARGDPIVVTGRVLTAFVLAMATVYPWYILMTLPLAALVRHRAWLVLSVLMPLAYVPKHTPYDLWPWFWVVMWIPFFVLLPLSSWRQEHDDGASTLTLPWSTASSSATAAPTTPAGNGKTTPSPSSNDSKKRSSG